MMIWNDCFIRERDFDMTSFKTCESVCIGHPDKLCDLIADSILDECLRLDKSSRVACEVMATGHKIIVAGEITCSKRADIRFITRQALRKAGYDPLKYLIYVYVHKQSEDIDGGVSRALELRNGDTSWYSTIGAGDQGTVYGYATNETKSLIPLPLELAHQICKRVDKVRSDGTVKGIFSDGKAQVTIQYEDGKPVRVKTIVVSVQHSEGKDLDVLRSEIIANVLWPVFEGFPFDNDTEILVNPSGRFVKGGPAADTGLTGRKIIVDTYGGEGAHGGGAFSGKDPTKVDRSAAYMARCVAVSVVQNSLADKCQVAVSYAIGKADPVAVQVDTFGTGKYSDTAIRNAVIDTFNFRPAAIIEFLKLRDTDYSETSTYGHFGACERWEWNHCSQELREAVKKHEQDND